MSGNRIDYKDECYASTIHAEGKPMILAGMDAARVITFPGQTSERSYGHAAAGAAAAAEVADIGVIGELSRKTGQSPSSTEKQYHQDESASERMVQEAIDKANKVLVGSNRRFEVSIHEKTKAVMVKVIDSDTNETIKEIPPKKLVDVMVSLCEMAGIIFDKKG